MKNEKLKMIVVLLLSSTMVTSVSCRNDESSSIASDGTGSEVVTAAISGVVAASEGSVALGKVSSQVKFLAKLQNYIDPIPNSWASSSCDWLSNITSCNANIETITFSSCSSSIDHAISIRGSETLYWTGSGCCTSNPLSAQSPCSFNRRTVNKNGERDPLIRSVGVNAITLDTEYSSGFSESKNGGFVIACQGSGVNTTCDGQRQITILGAHYVGQSGRALWDHTVSTDIPLVVQGHGPGRVVLSGKIRTQHNLAHYVTTSEVASPLTYDKNCCVPTGGGIVTSFVGGPYDGKVEVMTYGPECGSARLDDSDHQESGLTLHHCL